jgi:hypothetical protein
MRFALIAAALAVASCASASRPAGDDAATFARFKGLAGDWVQSGTTEAPQGAKVTYRVSAGGSAVVETIFGGSPQEMVTVYTLDDGHLVLTHYCMLGNQPRMDVTRTDGDVAFELTSLGNGDPAKDMHMHRAVFSFVDANHLTSAWTLWQDGKEGETHSFALQRVN